MTREDENLSRWRQSGEPRVWVKAHDGHWDHADWLTLLDTLRRSSYWPMNEADIGRVLEECRVGKQEQRHVEADPERPISALVAALLHLLAEGDVGVLGRLRRFLLDPADTCAERWQSFRAVERDAWKVVELTLLQRLFERRLKEGELDSWASQVPFGEDILGALKDYFAEWEVPDFPAEPEGFAVFAFQELRAARMSGVLSAECRTPWDRVVEPEALVASFASRLEEQYPLLAQVVVNDQLGIVNLTWVALCFRLGIDKDVRQGLHFIDGGWFDSGADASLQNLACALYNWGDTIEELIGDVYADSTLRQRHRMEAARERLHRPLSAEEDAELEREARAEVQAILGQSRPIQARTLAEAFAEAERLRESQNVLVAQNSLWAWFCALPPDQRAAIGIVEEGKYAKVRFYAKVRVKLSKG